MTDPQPPGDPLPPTVEAGAPGDALPTADRVVRSSALVGLGTALSRITGFVRLAAVAYAVGFTRLTDTYNLANTTPNIVYELVLGGILSAPLVRIFVEHLEEDDDDATSAVVTVAASALAAMTVAGVLAAPWIVRLYTFRLEGAEAAAQDEVATALLRLFMPQMFFYGLTALGTALLHARRSFAIPAFAPVLNNLIVAGVFLALPQVVGETPELGDVRDDTGLILLLGLGTTAGIVTMTLALWPALRATGLRLRPRLDWRHPAVATVVRLSGWTVGYAAANQLALWVVLVLANETAGGVAAYQGAFVFFQLPHGLFAVSLMTTVAPDLASTARRGDFAAFRDRFGLGLRLMALVVVPGAVGYLLLGRPVVSALLERGAFSGASAELTGDILQAFAVGLVPFSIYLYALRAFVVGLRDTRTPFLINAAENALNVVLALALEPALGVQGLALAYAIAYGVAAFAALALLARRTGGLGLRAAAPSFGRVVAAASVMAIVVAVASQAVGSETGGGSVVRTATGVGVGALTYLAVLGALRAPELGLLRGRASGPRPPGAV